MSGLTFANQVGAVNGMNQAAPGTFIPDSFIRWGQDVLFDRAGMIRRRAPWQGVRLFDETGVGLAQPSVDGERVIGLVSTLNPENRARIGIVVSGPGTTRILFYDDDYKVQCQCPLDNVNEDSIVFSRPALGGGAFIGVMEEYGIPDGGSNEHFLYFWRGGTGRTMTITNVNFGVSGSGNTSTFTNIISATSNTATTTTPSTSLVGAFNTALFSPGQFVYRVSGGNDYYIGTVKSVISNQITLEKDIIRTQGHEVDADDAGSRVNQTIKIVNVRPYIHNHGRGLITYDGNGGDITSGTIGTEGEGHFAAAGVGTEGDWAVYRASDGEWVADVIATNTDNQTLGVSTTHYGAITMNADEYVAYRYDIPVSGYVGNNPARRAGVFNTSYAGYQWFGNGGTPETHNRIVFSAYHNAESVDLSRDASDSIVLPGAQQMRGMASSNSGLVVFQEDKTYLVRGNYRANFSLEELYPEGCLSASSIVEYGGGVFWAAKNGILFFDGATVRNLTETNLGVYYTDSIKSFDAIRDHIFSFLYKDYLFIHFTSFNSVYKPVRYEPLYAQDINNTPAIQNFQYGDWDPDFSMEDVDPVYGNVPIYWDYLKMYEASGASAGTTVPVWGSGYSFPNAVVSGSPFDTMSGLSVSGVNSNTNAPYTHDTGNLNVGDKILGFGLPAGLEVATIVNSDTITLNMPLSGNFNGTVQIIPASADNSLWSAANGVWGPLNLTEGLTFAIYLPTNAVSVTSNFSFRGFVKLDQTGGKSGGVKGFAAYNAVNPEFTVTKKSLTSNVATLTLLTSSIANGSKIIVSGVDTTFDGEYTVTASSGNTISYAKTAGDIAEIETTGTINHVGVYARLLSVDTMLDTNYDYTVGEDAELCENIGKNPKLYYKGPDFYLQTKHYTFGDPTLRKWFRQLFLNMYFVEGGMRMDVVDNEDKDSIDIQKKRQRNWAIFEDKLYSWRFVEDNVLPRVLSPDRSEWFTLESKNLTWYELADSAFERHKKKISWRYPSMGFRLYQMNRYRPSNYRYAERPHRVAIDSWSMGFRPLRQSRV